MIVSVLSDLRMRRVGLAVEGPDADLAGRQRLEFLISPGAEAALLQSSIDIGSVHAVTHTAVVADKYIHQRRELAQYLGTDDSSVGISFNNNMVGIYLVVFDDIRYRRGDILGRIYIIIRIDVRTDDDSVLNPARRRVVEGQVRAGVVCLDCAVFVVQLPI